MALFGETTISARTCGVAGSSFDIFAARITSQWLGGIPGTRIKCRSMWAFCGPKRPYLRKLGATLWRNDEFRAYLWTARQFVRQILRRESLSNGAGEFRAPETKAVPLWPFVVGHGPSWHLRMRTVVSVEYSPEVSMERQTYILFPLLALNFRYFCRAKKCYDVSRRALLCGEGADLAKLL